MNKLLLDYIKRMAPNISEEQAVAIAQSFPAKTIKSGTILVRPGDIARDCYFVLQGCLRLYLIDEKGNDNTVDFYTEEQSLVIYEGYKLGKATDYGVEALEDCLLIIGDIKSEESANQQFSGLTEVTRNAIEEVLAGRQNDIAYFKSLSPEERYKHVLEKRPGLAGRVPQHQLNSTGYIM